MEVQLVGVCGHEIGEAQPGGYPEACGTRRETFVAEGRGALSEDPLEQPEEPSEAAGFRGEMQRSAPWASFFGSKATQPGIFVYKYKKEIIFD